MWECSSGQEPNRTQQQTTVSTCFPLKINENAIELLPMELRDNLCSLSVLIRSVCDDDSNENYV